MTWTAFAILAMFITQFHHSCTQSLWSSEDRGRHSCKASLSTGSSSRTSQPGNHCHCQSNWCNLRFVQDTFFRVLWTWTPPSLLRLVQSWLLLLCPPIIRCLGSFALMMVLWWWFSIMIMVMVMLILYHSDGGGDVTFLMLMARIVQSNCSLSTNYQMPA